MDSTAQDRFARLKALRPAPALPAANAGRELVYVPDESGVCAWGIPEHADALARLLGASPARNRFGEHLALRCWFPDPSAAPDPAALRLLAPEAAKEDAVVDPRQWLFLDTETTGLAGGTGTYAFLVGIAWWDRGGLQVEQFFLRELSEETSLLAALAERLAERPVLATFNGKAFDWPLLETRYRMTRQIPPPALRAHLDLLHPARNLWRLRLGSVRLVELERHVLGWDRGADVMSELIPRMYLEFLRGGPAEPLVPVVRHNQMDLRGLARLSCRVLALLAQPESCGEDGLEVYGVSRICERHGETARARKLYQHSLAAALPAEVERAARLKLARLAKRQGDRALSCKLWEETLGGSREGFEAYEQLAMHYEHNARRPEHAAALVHEALAKLRQAQRLDLIAAETCRRLRARFEHRLARLQRKTAFRNLRIPEPA